MHGVVSILDDHHCLLVENLWTELSSRFGVSAIYTNPYPHFSYHIAESYDLGRLANLMHHFCAKYRPFAIRTGGLGIFTGLAPVLAIAVVRDGRLNRFHSELWSALSGTSAGLSPHYSPDEWVPHITLATDVVHDGSLGAMVQWLNSQKLVWQIQVDNLSLIYNTEGNQSLLYRLPLNPDGVAP